jgi:hypothetical protein
MANNHIDWPIKPETTFITQDNPGLRHRFLMWQEELQKALRNE